MVVVGDFWCYFLCVLSVYTITPPASIVHHLGLKNLLFLLRCFSASSNNNNNNKLWEHFSLCSALFMSFSLNFNRQNASDGIEKDSPYINEGWGRWKLLLAHNMQVRERLIVLFCKRRLDALRKEREKILFSLELWFMSVLPERRKISGFFMPCMYVRYVVNSDFSKIGDFHNLINFHAIKKFCAIQPHEGLLLKYGVSWWVCTWGRQCLLGVLKINKKDYF